MVCYDQIQLILDLNYLVFTNFRRKEMDFEYKINVLNAEKKVIKLFPPDLVKVMEYIGDNDYTTASSLIDKSLEKQKNKNQRSTFQDIFLSHTNEAFSASYYLLNVITKVRAREKKFLAFNFHEIKEKMMTICSSLVTTFHFCTIFDHLMEIFLQHNLLIGANCCMRLSLQSSIDLHVVYDRSESFTYDYHHLECQIKYGIQVFSFSSQTLQDPLLLTEALKVRENIFQDLLKNIKNIDFCCSHSLIRDNKVILSSFFSIIYQK